jgi:DNA repair exonuclease SbcCD nuclease subunit
VKLFHAADIHLGRRRLEGRLPDTDFAAAFEHIARAAIAERADVFLLAGDLFDRPQVEPPHLRQAQRVLAVLKEARIPVVAIEGNHDKAFLSAEAPTWLDYLAQDELLVLLRPCFDASGAVLEPWDAVAKRGAWIEIGGITFTGAGYLGAATPHKVRQIVERLDAAKTNVLLLHAGPDYFVGEGGGFSSDDLRAIREKVRYLALGHIHRPMLHGGWACNPGSPENCELREALSVGERGYAIVTLGAETTVRIASNPRRPCLHLELDCTPFGNKLKDGAAALEKAAVKLLAAQLAPPSAAVEIRLIGQINLNRIALDADALSRAIEQAANVAAVCVNPAGINLGAAPAAESEPRLSREELERAALRELIDAENLWGLDGEQPEFARLFFDLKESVRLARPAGEIAETIRTHPLVEKIRLAQEAHASS